MASNAIKFTELICVTPSSPRHGSRVPIVIICRPNRGLAKEQKEQNAQKNGFNAFQIPHEQQQPLEQLAVVRVDP